MFMQMSNDTARGSAANKYSRQEVAPHKNVLFVLIAPSGCLAKLSDESLFSTCSPRNTNISGTLVKFVTFKNVAANQHSDKAVLLRFCQSPA